MTYSSVSKSNPPLLDSISESNYLSSNSDECKLFSYI